MRSWQILLAFVLWAEKIAAHFRYKICQRRMAKHFPFLHIIASINSPYENLPFTAKVKKLSGHSAYGQLRQNMTSLQTERGRTSKPVCTQASFPSDFKIFV